LIETWTGIISLLSLLSGNVEATIGHAPFPTEQACKDEMKADIPMLQERLELGRNGGNIKVLGSCVRTVPEDSF
jgi:hypothetical protein